MVAHLSMHPAASGCAKSKRSFFSFYGYLFDITEKFLTIENVRHCFVNKTRDTSAHKLSKPFASLISRRYLRICIVIAQEVPVSQSKIFKFE